MADDESPRDAKPRRPVAARVGALALEATALGFLVAAGGTLVVYEARKDIARGVAEDWLRQHGVEAQITVERLDATGFSGRIRLGPRADPDLIADRIDVEYALTPPWTGEPFALSARSIRLVRPRVKLAFDGERLNFGTLDPLVQDLLKRPKTNEPAPDIVVEDGEARLATPYGLVRVAGADAALANGKLMQLHGRLLAADLKAGDASAQLTGGEVHARGDGEKIDAVVALALAQAGQKDQKLREADLILALEDVRYTLAGRTITASGRGRLRADAAAIEAGSTRLAKPRLQLSLDDLRVTSGDALSGGFDAAGTLTAPALETEQATARGLAVQARLRGASWSTAAGGFRLRAPLTLAVAVDSLPIDVSGTPLPLSALQADFQGRLDTGADAPLTGRLDASGAGGLRPSDAARIAAAAPVLGQEDRYRAALQRALARFTVNAPNIALAVGSEGVDARVNGPVRLASASGATASLTPKGLRFDGGGVSGAAALAVSGDGLPAINLDATDLSVRGEVMAAQVALSTTFDFGPAKDAAMSIRGRARNDRAGFTFTAASCASLKAERLDLGETQIEQPSGQLCPAEGGAPLVVARQGEWRLAGRLQEGRASIPTLMVEANEASGGFLLAGGEDGSMTAQVSLADIGLTDTAEPVRFKPLRSSGTAQLVGDIWRGDFAVRTPAGHVIGKIALEHDQASGAGHADIDASQLRFAVGGLQPADISPQAVVLDRAEGPAAFTGRLSWTAEQPANGGGRVTTQGLNFISPLGAVAELRADVTFTSLMPLTTAPDQVITARLVEAFADLTDLSLVFDLAGDVLHVDLGALSAVGGRLELEPLTLPLGQEATVRGAIVLDNVDLGQVIALTAYADRIKSDLIIDGRLPFEAGPKSFHFEKGRLAAVGPGRLSISRTVLTGVETGAAEVQAPDLGGETVGQPDVNAVQDLAYQALENLAVESLSATVESLPGGRLGVIFAIKGEHSPAVAERATMSLRDLISRQAFNRRIPLPKGTPIDLTLDTSLNFDEVLEGVRSSFQTFRELRLERSDTVQP